MMNKNNKPKVTVMMPVYNGEALIGASVKSLLNQTFTDWECIIVNDGSTDSTADYLAKITDPRFKIISFKKNKGRAAAREKALSVATGEYLAMLDADDIYHPEKLERQVKILDENPDVALAGCVICSFGTKCDITYKRASRFGKYAYDGQMPSHASSMLRTKRAQLFHYNSKLNYAEDAYFMKQYLKGQMIIITNDILYYYSELDSVTKSKLISCYKMAIRYWLHQGLCGIPKILINTVKYVIGSLVYPFIDIKCLLAKRGIPLTDHELLEYKELIYPFIESHK